MVELTLQFPGDGVGEVDPQDGPRPPLAPPSPLAPHHGGQTAQVVDHPHSPCSTRPHFSSFPFLPSVQHSNLPNKRTGTITEFFEKKP